LRGTLIAAGAVASVVAGVAAVAVGRPDHGSD
jgi:hypothetical protein